MSATLPEGFELEADPMALPPGFELEPDPEPISPMQGGADLGRSFIDAMAAGAQGTSPVVQGLDQVPNYQLAPPEEQAFFDEVGQPRDAQKFVALRNPQTGKMSVYLRNEKMNEGAPIGLGRMLGFGMMAGVGSIPKAATQGPTIASRAQSFAEAGITPNVADVTQGRGSRILMNALKEVPGAAGRIEESANAELGQAAQGAAKIADTYGGAQTPAQAGRQVQGALQGFRTAESGLPADEVFRLPTRASSVNDKARALYEAIPIDPATPAAMDRTVSALEGLSTKFPSNPEFGKLLQEPKFANYLDKLANGNPLSFQEMKDFRSYVGARLGSGGLQTDIPSSEWKRLYAAISDDMKRTAEQAGPDALKAFNRANSYYSAASDRIEKALTSVFDAKSPEEAFAKIEAAAMDKGPRADVGKLYALQRSMPKDAWGDVSSVLIRRMGQKIPSAADPSGASPDFSASTFITNYEKMSPEARFVLFGANGMAESQKALDNLAKAVGLMKNTERLANTSGTGRVLGTSALTAGLVTDPTSTILGVLGSNIGARAMTNPQIVNTLAAISRASAAGNTKQAANLTANVLKIIDTNPDYAGLGPVLRRALSPVTAEPTEQPVS